jgi:hypothetical protein
LNATGGEISRGFQAVRFMLSKVEFATSNRKTNSDDENDRKCDKRRETINDLRETKIKNGIRPKNQIDQRQKTQRIQNQSNTETNTQAQKQQALNQLATKHFPPFPIPPQVRLDSHKT